MSWKEWKYISLSLVLLLSAYDILLGRLGIIQTVKDIKLSYCVFSFLNRYLKHKKWMLKVL